MDDLSIGRIRVLASRMKDNVPVVHGNGFIQVWLSGSERLHVWHPKCPRQHTYTGLHDHRFSFRSTIFRGRIVNRTWDERAGNAYDIWTPRQAHDVPNSSQESLLCHTGRTCSLTNGHEDVYGAGEHYDMAIGQIHDGFAHSKMAVTVMRVTGRNLDWPVRVLCPMGLSPDNAFQRHGFGSNWLWHLIEEAMR